MRINEIINSGVVGVTEGIDVRPDGKVYNRKGRFMGTWDGREFTMDPDVEAFLNYEAGPEVVAHTKAMYKSELSNQGVAEGSDLGAQAMDIATKLTTGKNLEKLRGMAYDSTVYRALDRYFAKHNIPETIYNRVASIVFKRINQQGVAEGSNDDELNSRPGMWRGKADMAKRMTKKGVPTKSELGFQDNLKNRIKASNRQGGLTGPKGVLPEDQGVAEGIDGDTGENYAKELLTLQKQKWARMEELKSGGMIPHKASDVAHREFYAAEKELQQRYPNGHAAHKETEQEKYRAMFAKGNADFGRGDN